MRLNSIVYFIIFLPVIWISVLRLKRVLTVRQAQFVSILGYLSILGLIISAIWILSTQTTLNRYSIAFLSNFLTGQKITFLISFFIDPLSGISLFITGFILLFITVSFSKYELMSTRFFFEWGLLLLFSIGLFVLGGSFLISFAGWTLLTYCLYKLIHIKTRDSISPKLIHPYFMLLLASDVILLMTIVNIYNFVGSLDYHIVQRFVKLAAMRSAAIPISIPIGLLVSICLKISIFPFINGLKISSGFPLLEKLVYFTVVIPSGFYLMLRNYVFFEAYPLLGFSVGLMSMILGFVLVFSVHSLNQLLPITALLIFGHLMTLTIFASYTLLFAAWIISTLSFSILAVSTGHLIIRNFMTGEDTDEILMDSDISVNSAVMFSLKNWPAWIAFFTAAGIPPFGLFAVWQFGIQKGFARFPVWVGINIGILINIFLVLGISRFIYWITCHIPPQDKKTFKFSVTPWGELMMIAGSILVMVFSYAVYALAFNSNPYLSSWLQPIFSNISDISVFKIRPFILHVSIICMITLFFLVYLQAVSRQTKPRTFRVGWFRWAATQYFWIDELFSTTGFYLTRLAEICWSFDSFVYVRVPLMLHKALNWSGQMLTVFDESLFHSFPQYIFIKIDSIVEKMTRVISKSTWKSFLLIMIGFALILALSTFLRYPMR